MQVRFASIVECRRFLALIGLPLAALVLLVCAPGGRASAEPFVRKTPSTWPTWHVTALPSEIRWFPGDANGCIFWKGKYHLMYIFQDFAHRTGRHCWGHVVSTDLVNWTYLPPALVPAPGDPDQGIFSGNAFINKQGRPTLCYHGIGAGICLAEAEDDDLIHWKKNPHNPIIPVHPPGKKYTVGDPYLWLEKDTYYCLLGGNRLKNRDTLYLMKSPDLATWTPVGPFFEGNPAWRNPEEDCSCPEFFSLGSKHVLMCISHVVGARFYVGTYEPGSEKFVPEQHVRMNWPGGMLFAPESLADDKGRRIFWAWITDPRIEATQERDGGGYQCLPRILELSADGTPRIRPVPELEQLRRNHRTQSNIALPAGKPVDLPGIAGDSFELGVEIDPAAAKRVGLLVRCSPGGEEQTAIWYDPGKHELSIDMSKSTLRKDVIYGKPLTGYLIRGWERPDPKKSIRSFAAPLTLAKGAPLKLRVFLDKSILEVFANDRQCLTQLIYPQLLDSKSVRAVAEEGAATIRALDAWDMAPANFVDHKGD